jgi:hypothetical protein
MKWYVYKHFVNDEQKPFYIGIGKKDDFKRAKTNCDRNKFWYNIVNKYGFEYKITHFDLCYEEACSIEKYLILFYGRRDKSSGCLCNLTDGGEGASNISEENRIKRTIRFSGSNNPNYGKKMSNEQKSKISNTLKLKNIKPPNWHYTEKSAKIRDKISKKLIGNIASKNKRELLSKYNKGENNFFCKINEDIAKNIKIMLVNGLSVKEISKSINVSIKIIQHIKYNKTWKHIII